MTMESTTTSSSSNNNAPPQVVVVVGIDIGAESTKVVLGSAQSCEIVRSPSGLHTTPTAVAFGGKTRHVGETAALGTKNTICHLNRLLLDLSGEFSEFSETILFNLEDFYPFQVSDENGTKFVTVDSTTTTGSSGTSTTSLSASSVLAVLLSQIQTSVETTVQRLLNSTSTSPSVAYKYLFTVTPTLNKQALLDAAFAAGMDLNSTFLVETPVAQAMAYQRKFPHLSNGEVVLIVDMGHSQTTVSVVQFGAAKNAKNEEGEDTDETEKEPKQEEEEKDNQNDTPTFTILSTKTNPSLGATSVDLSLWHHYQSTLPTLANITPTSRAGQRLLTGTHKLKHLLSQLPNGQVTVENVGANDTDVVLTGSRANLADLCKAPMAALKTLIQEALLQQANTIPLHAVEVVGGGCRIPWVQTTIQQVVAEIITGCQEMTLSKSLDDTSAAMGAALVGDTTLMDNNNNSNNSKLIVPMPPILNDEATLQRRQQLREQELAMAAIDQMEHAKADKFNQIEAKILELRGAKHSSAHGQLLPGQLLDDYLNEMEEWLFSEQVDTATLEEMDDKLQQVLAKTQELCAEYYQAVQQEQLTKEQDMEAAAKQAQAEAEAAQGENGGGGGDDDEADHDTRRLPKKRRMEIVLKNKQEANELFKDGNWRFAAARYTKALTHCAKFVDLSPDDIKEVNELKVTLNLNLALAYMKLENIDQAMRVCNEALALDDTSVKAYFRRASIWYEKKRWDEAKADVNKAKKLLGDDSDKAIQKLAERIDLQLKKEKQKEKKMASKMFA